MGNVSSGGCKGTGEEEYDSSPYDSPSHPRTARSITGSSPPDHKDWKSFSPVINTVGMTETRRVGDEWLY